MYYFADGQPVLLFLFIYTYLIKRITRIIVDTHCILMVYNDCHPYLCRFVGNGLAQRAIQIFGRDSTRRGETEQCRTQYKEGAKEGIIHTFHRLVKAANLRSYSDKTIRFCRKVTARLPKALRKRAERTSQTCRKHSAETGFNRELFL